MNKTDRLLLAIVTNAIEITLILVVTLVILPIWGIVIPVYAAVVIVVVWLCFSVFLYQSGSRALSVKPAPGLPDMAGLKGVVVKTISPRGTVRVKGELWHARAEKPLEVGEEVIVVSTEGMTLVVKLPDNG